MIWPFGRQGPAANFRQLFLQMARRRCTYHLLVCALFGDGITVTHFRGLAPPLSVLSLIGAPARKKRSKVSADALRASVASKIL